MDGENTLCELGQMAYRQGKHAYQKGQQQPILPGVLAARAPPDQSKEPA